MILEFKDYLIIISEDVLNIFKTFKQDQSYKKESGGIIFSEVAGKTVYLNKVSTPNKFDRSTRTSFTRDKDAAQVIVNFEFTNTQGKTIYIGEWHTHPENYPKPSSQDIAMIQKQFKGSILSEKFILLMIIGIKGLYLGLYDGKSIEEHYCDLG